MGIHGLQTFMIQSVPNGTKPVDILQSISEWKSTHDEKCLIVVDVMSVLTLVCADVSAALCGFRYWQMLQEIRAFWQRLRDAGAELVFFCDGPTQNDKMEVWRRRQEDQTKFVHALTDALNRGDSLTTIVKSSLVVKNQYVIIFPELLGYREMCAEFGKVYVSVERECDCELAKYATDNDALAVLGQDTDFLIFAGNWKYWSSHKLAFSTNSTIEYNRIALRQYLQLDDDQMPVLAALCGNDILSCDSLRAFHRSLGPFYMKFVNCARVIRTNSLRSLDGDDDNNNAKKECILILAVRYSFDANQFWKAVDAYDIGYATNGIDNPSSSRLQTEAYGCSDILAFLKPFVTTMSLCSFDMRHVGLLRIEDLFIPMFRRQAGVAWLDHRDDGTAAEEMFSLLRTKLSLESEYIVMNVKPEFPAFSTPTVKELHTNQHEDLTDARYRLFVWVVTGKDDRELMEKIVALPTGYAICLVTLLYLTRMGQFTLTEADDVLAVEIDVMNERVGQFIPYPEKITAHNLLLARLYARFNTHIRRSMKLCGIQWQKDNAFGFDSVHFHQCRNNRAEAKMDLDDLATSGRPGFAEMREFYAPAAE